ncbi:Murein DD-endopeptidase MepS/Murein LD-carboxypeptidase precursor [compost metagenome]
MPRLLSVKTIVIIFTGILLITTAVSCNQRNQGPEVKSLPKKVNPPVHAEYVKESDGTVWIPLDQVARSFGLRHKEQDHKIKIGYTDVMLEIESGSKKAKAFGKAVTLSKAPITRNGIVYVDEASLSRLLNTNVQFDHKNQLLHVESLYSPEDDAAVDHSKDSKLKRYKLLSVADNQDQLVSYAKQYLGVPYEFGADPYEQSKTFDCSSFTQHVYKRFGQSLPRLARDQAKLGKRVERSELQVGDLIFFTVPGRFENDKVAGHVGIYIGDGRFIHTWGEPGVQISPLDSGYWNKMILSMRRIS